MYCRCRATEEPPAESKPLHEEVRKETGEDEGFEDTEDAGDEQSDREDEGSKSGKLTDEIHKDVPDLTEETNSDVDEVWDRHVLLGTVQWKVNSSQASRKVTVNPFTFLVVCFSFSSCYSLCSRSKTKI